MMADAAGVGSSSSWPRDLASVLAMWLVVKPLGRHLARRADTGAPLSPRERASLTTAFEALGPERVTRGLTAAGHGWTDCFLALAMSGQPYGLRPGLAPGWRANGVVSLSVDVTEAAVRTWDRKEAAFRALAAEWLDRSRRDDRWRAGRVVAAGPRYRAGSSVALSTVCAGSAMTPEVSHA
jgi:hypothetical protein